MILMKKNETTDALKLSLLPAVLASSCCLTAPAIGLLGFSTLESVLIEYKWYFRLLALIVLLLSVWWYVFRQGIDNKSAFREHREQILLITGQTLLFGLGIYFIFLYIVVPHLCNATGFASCTI